MFGNNHHSDYRSHPIKILFFAAVFVTFILGMGAIVMFLWNAILPDAIGVKPLTFWKAVGLLVLFKILFGGFGKGSRMRHKAKNKWRKKWMDMNEQERHEFKSKWKDYCNRRRSE
jgi:hypothetical protein